VFLISNLRLTGPNELKFRYSGNFVKLLGVDDQTVGGARIVEVLRIQLEQLSKRLISFEPRLHSEQISQ
jgi:methyl coenzyme M reductase gamma subunit